LVDLKNVEQNLTTTW